MDDFAQIASQITQMRNFFVNEAVATVQQVQAGAGQIQQGGNTSPVDDNAMTSPNGLVWFCLGTIAALAVAYCFWKR